MLSPHDLHQTTMEIGLRQVLLKTAPKDIPQKTLQCELARPQQRVEDDGAVNSRSQRKDNPGAGAKLMKSEAQFAECVMMEDMRQHNEREQRNPERLITLPAPDVK